MDGRFSGKATVPGAIHNDLLLNRQIPDPFYRDEALRLGWIDTTTWIYELTVYAHTEVPLDRHLELVFEGLDTYAHVRINGQLVLDAANMFRQWRINLDTWRAADSLVIQITFDPAIIRGQEFSTGIPWTYPADSDPFPGKPSVFTRKAACQFGWDFAPPMPGCGVWKQVYLDSRSDLQVSDAWLQTTRIHGDTAEVVMHTTLISEKEQLVHLEARVNDLVSKRSITVLPGQFLYAFPFQIIHPDLWWPQHAGDPVLCNAQVIARSESGSDTQIWKAGIRTITLDQTPDSQGTPFTFVVNGRPVFAVGANWVPADLFPGRIAKSTYRELLLSAFDAGFNMLRVWGGGIYEDDLFYHLADSLGILVWQDFMFANTMYPGDTSFLQNVNREVTEQVIRLRKHPSLALWCGNNEIDVAWKNWGWSSTYGWGPDAINWMKGDYDILFKGMLPELVEQLHPGARYVQTSPLSNWGDPADLAHGDNHFWGVWHGEMPLDSLRTRVPRFMSEYGMQSLPSWSSVERFSNHSDWQADSPVMQFHQRSYKGNRLIDRYRVMEGDPDPGDDFQAWVKMSHHLQAKAYQIAITTHLDAKPYCMGSLLWQFNEPWPGASWSIIDYYGEKKPAYFAIQDVIARKMIENSK